MTPKKLLKLTASFLRHPFYTAYALQVRGPETQKSFAFNIRAAADWLLVAQKNSTDGEGYSRSFSLFAGWDRGYIETTGYIIPTLFDVAAYLNESKYRDSALRAGEWLLGVQTEEGAFTDIDGYRPQAFDTGQVLLGLNRLFRETSDLRFLSAAHKAGEWLTRIQEADGAWIKFAYHGRPHSYYSRVAAALVETGQLVGEDRLIAAGQRNLEWVLRQQTSNGYFALSEFRPYEDALLHTIVYVLEGLLMAAGLLGNTRLSDAAIRGTIALHHLRDPSGLLFSQYDPRWVASNTERCVTGLAQFAGVCFDVAELTGDNTIAISGKHILEHLCAWQCRRGEAISGALPSSIPIWGYYGGMAFFNWNAKFFLDAALKYERLASRLTITGGAVG